LFTGRISAEGTHFALTDGLTLPLGGAYSRWRGQAVTLGIRPEHIALSSQAAGGIPLVVDTLEMLGADNLVHGRWGVQKLVVRLSHQQRPQPGSTLWLHLPEENLHFFDAENGKRL
ncbi:TOBE domain-containing protein, partial [Enterobacter sp. R1(2018)]|uniref:TOBE domain-containing protein n=1 Tax=Enterobacter sp. R1(2018) TaxID=2447891 RepID=UPI00217F0E28